MQSELQKYLVKNKIIYQYYEHEPVYTVEQSRKILAHLPGIGLKNLFLKAKDKDLYVLITMKGEKRLNLKQLEKEFTIKKFSFATEEELWEKLKTKPGHVSPFAIINDQKKEVRFLIDKEAWDAEKTNFHPLVNYETIVVNKENFHKLIESFQREFRVITLNQNI